MSDRSIFPFSAVVGSDDMALALVLTTVSPEVGGVLVRGEKGTAKSTMVRGLLHDHLVDLLLDAAAMGRNTVERDGVSVSHAARIVLVGTMNPEEGELRPQLLDRFGLTVEVAAPREPALRSEVVRRRLAFDAAPAAFAERFAAEQEAVRARIADARSRVGSVELPDRMLTKIAEVCAAGSTPRPAAPTASQPVRRAGPRRRPPRPHPRRGARPRS